MANSTTCVVFFLYLTVLLSSVSSAGITYSGDLVVLRSIQTDAWKNMDVENTDPCVSNWPGVICTKDNEIFYVTGIRLHHENASILANLKYFSELRFLQMLEVHTVGCKPTSNFLFSIPKEIGSLRYLSHLDMSDNEHLGGIIPAELGSISSLQVLLLGHSSLYGGIPKSLCNLTLLEALDLGQNQLTGTIPSCLGFLSNLKWLNLSSNQLSGSIPHTLGSLLNVVDLNLQDNLLSGRFPESLLKLSRLEKLSCARNFLEGSLPNQIGVLKSFQVLDLSFNRNMHGPIPRSIVNLSNLIELKLAVTGLTGHIPEELGKLSNLHFLDLHGNDLNGSISEQSISNLSQLQGLYLQGNNLSGPLPIQLSKLSSLVNISLSFNNLDGQLPAEYGNLSNLESLLLSDNQLCGPIPQEYKDLHHLKFFDVSHNKLNGSIPNNTFNEQTTQIDVSFNELTPSSKLSIDDCSAIICPESGCDISIQIHTKTDASCPGFNRKIAINAGGPAYNASTDNGPVLFQQDDVYRASVGFYMASACALWAESTTDGSFLINTSHSISHLKPVDAGDRLLAMNWGLFNTARVGGDSLSYYGKCMQRGIYMVELLFTEMLLNSSGKRVFDVFIQGKRVEKSLDVIRITGGKFTPLVRKYDVTVEDGNLWIELRGTSTPRELGSLYGPMISALCVSYTSKESKSRGMSLGVILGTSAAIVVVTCVLFFLGIYCKQSGNSNVQRNTFGLINFEYAELAAMTENFIKKNLLGQGAHGKVYKGVLPDGREVAIKQLVHRTDTCRVWFHHELEVISSVRHRNLVPLIGYCIDHHGFPLLVCEYMPNGSLHFALFDKDQPVLCWELRFRIAIDVARGLQYLHEDSPTKIVHRDVKPGNILLDGGMNAHISDFGLAKLIGEKKEEIVSSIMGTRGYLAPEYLMYGQLSEKVDVFSFGIVLLELASGKRGVQASIFNHSDVVALDEWAWEVAKTGKLEDIADPRLGKQYNQEQMILIIQVALWCTQSLPDLRPRMGQVLSMITGQIGVPDLPLERLTCEGFQQTMGFSSPYGSNISNAAPPTSYVSASGENSSAIAR